MRDWNLWTRENFYGNDALLTLFFGVLKDSFRCRSSDQILFETAPQLPDLALFTQAKAQVHAVQFRAAGLTEHKQSARVVVRG